MQLEINGRTYDAIDAKIFALGTEMRGVAMANYGFTREHTNRHAIGNDEPVNFSMGPKNYEEGQLSLYMEEVIAIEDATGGDKDITKIKPFKSIFTYVNDSGRGVADEVTWKFKSWGREVNVEGSGEAREFPMHIISIRPNID